MATLYHLLILGVIIKRPMVQILNLNQFTILQFLRNFLSRFIANHVILQPKNNLDWSLNMAKFLLFDFTTFFGHFKNRFQWKALFLNRVFEVIEPLMQVLWKCFHVHFSFWCQCIFIEHIHTFDNWSEIFCHFLIW